MGVNKKIIENFIKNHPGGLAALAVKAKVSVSTISNARNGAVPGREETRERIAKALGVTTSEVFGAAR